MSRKKEPSVIKKEVVMGGGMNEGVVEVDRDHQDTIQTRECPEVEDGHCLLIGSGLDLEVSVAPSPKVLGLIEG